jgi:hypothetical protein
MTTQPLFRDKVYGKLIAYTDMIIAAFIDNSGSTLSNCANNRFSQDNTVFSNQYGIVTALLPSYYSSVCLWSTEAYTMS